MVGFYINQIKGNKIETDINIINNLKDSFLKNKLSVFLMTNFDNK